MSFDRKMDNEIYIYICEFSHGLGRSLGRGQPTPTPWTEEPGGSQSKDCKEWDTVEVI